VFGVLQEGATFVDVLAAASGTPELAGAAG
jgi:hypothetical protein